MQQSDNTGESITRLPGRIVQNLENRLAIESPSRVLRNVGGQLPKALSSGLDKGRADA